MTGTTYPLGEVGNRLPEILAAARTFSPFLPLTLDYLDVKALTFPTDARLPNGLRVRLLEREETKILWHIFVRECYALAGSESVILDLGANVGFFALYAALKAPKAHIYSAEPVPSTFRRLLHHLEWNGLNDRVTALNFAVTGAMGIRFIARENVPAGQTRLLCESDAKAAELSVQCRTPESIFDDSRLEQVDLTKVDIEGSEYEPCCLRGWKCYARSHAWISRFITTSPRKDILSITSGTT